MPDFQLLTDQFLPAYRQQARVDWEELIRAKREEWTAPNFEYYLVASSVFSSKIEGNSLDVNSFMRNRTARRRKEIREIEDLIRAYQFATEQPLTLPNLLTAHATLSKSLVGKPDQGKYRSGQIGVFDSTTGRPVYLAVEPPEVSGEMEKLFADVGQLMQSEIATDEVFYYASLLHLWLAMIHPFQDGNGRAARLLEKWFLATKLGLSTWGTPSEKFYWDHREAYYRNIALGYNYYALHWEWCLPFLEMLPEAAQL